MARRSMNLPAVLKPLTKDKRWVVWKLEERKNKDGSVYKTKIPYQPNGSTASSTESKSWSSYDEALAAYLNKNQFDGIGYCLIDSDYSAIDMDSCIIDDEVVAPALEIIERVQSYTEISPSGRGIRIIGRSSANKSFTTSKKLIGHGAGIELYQRGKKYVTITGNVLMGHEYELADITDVVEDLHEKFFKAEEPKRGRGRPKKEIVLSKTLRQLLFAKDNGDFDSRSDLAFAFVTECIRTNIDDDTIISALLDNKYKGCSIWEHVHDQSNPEKYAEAQIEHAINKNVIRGERIKDLPFIRYQPQIPDETRSAVEKALIKARMPVLVVNGILMEPIWQTYSTYKGKKTTTCHFHMLTPLNLSGMVTRYIATFKRRNGKKWMDIAPPREVFQLLIDKGQWGFNKAIGIICSPTLRPDGTILKEQGYDESTQLWYQTDIALKDINVKDKPTRDDAEKALAVFKHLFSEVPFKSENDFSVALAAVLTTVARGAFRFAPIFLVGSPTPGTGKGYLVNVVSMIAQGRACPVLPATRKSEEMEKRLSSMLFEGVPFFSIDNVNFDLNNDLLKQMVSEYRIRARRLGTNDVPDCEWRGTIFVTGNNISLVGSLTRRHLRCDIDSNEEHPELRKFKLKPMEMVGADRGKYIEAALTIVRAYSFSKDKVEYQEIGTYEDWGRFVQAPIVWLGLIDPFKGMEAAYEMDNIKQTKSIIFEEIKRIFKDGAFTAAELASEASSIKSWQGYNQEFQNPLLNEAMIEITSARNDKIEVRRVGWWLKNNCDRIHDNDRLIRTKENVAGHSYRLKSVNVDKNEVETDVIPLAPHNKKSG